MRRVVLALFFLFSMAIVVVAQDADPVRDAKARSIMHSIYTPLSELLPFSMDYKKFSDPANRDVIKKNINELQANVHNLESHAKSRTAGFRFLSHSFARDVKEIKTWYELGRFEEAQFVIHNLTENCIACHSQQPSHKDFSQATDLTKKVEIAKLPLMEKAQLLVATRQFDEALKTYEDFFKSTELSPAQMALMQAFPDYLKVAIRVKGDLKRPIPVLEQWSKREGVPAYMQAHIKEWISSLQTVSRKNLMKNPSLANAKKLMKLGQTDIISARSREKLIYFISASSILLQLVNTRTTKPEEFAEAYYLLGLCESVIGRSFWISQTELFLESAIRADPGSSVAKKAYKELEEQLYGEFSGSSGTHIPDDVNQMLKDLKGVAFSEKTSKPQTNSKK